MVQDLDNVGMGGKQALLAWQPFVLLIHLEDGDKSELVVQLVVVVEVEQDLDCF
jgi:hypothetical protein